ncbi:MAG TPA: YceD family protein [Rhizomicrobium sp.]|jgi:uncharacterized metal-binding protein YceD (DUF177 family)
MPSAPPLSNVIDLAVLPQAGEELVIAPNAGQRSRLAEWTGVDAVDHFEARVTVKKLSPSRFGYEADVNADVVQSCVVTLEPVRSHLAFQFAREFHLVRSASRLPDEAFGPEAAQDDVPEEITDTKFDVAGPVLEEFALAIDPYPRAPGVAYRPEPEPEEARESPFAALKRLKNTG